jgi:hypothetical protein
MHHYIVAHLSFWRKGEAYLFADTAKINLRHPQAGRFRLPGFGNLSWNT